MPACLVVSFRGAASPRRGGDSSYLERALALKKRAEALGAVLCAWGAEAFAFSLSVDDVEEALALAALITDGEAPPEGRLASAIAQGEMVQVGDPGTFAKLSWGRPLVVANALACTAVPGEMLIDAELWNARPDELVASGAWAIHDAARDVLRLEVTPPSEPAPAARPLGGRPAPTPRVALPRRAEPSPVPRPPRRTEAEPSFRPLGSSRSAYPAWGGGLEVRGAPSDAGPTPDALGSPSSSRGDRERPSAPAPSDLPNPAPSAPSRPLAASGPPASTRGGSTPPVGSSSPEASSPPVDLLPEELTTVPPPAPRSTVALAPPALPPPPMRRPDAGADSPLPRPPLLPGKAAAPAPPRLAVAPVAPPRLAVAPVSPPRPAVVAPGTPAAARQSPARAPAPPPQASSLASPRPQAGAPTSLSPASLPPASLSPASLPPGSQPPTSQPSTSQPPSSSPPTTPSSRPPGPLIDPEMARLSARELELDPHVLAGELADLAKQALVQGDLGTLERLLMKLRVTGGHVDLVERMSSFVALGRGATSEALRKLRSAAESESAPERRARARLAYAVGLASAGRTEAAILEVLEALARAREHADRQGQEACARFLARLSAGAGHPHAADQWAEIAATPVG